MRSGGVGVGVGAGNRLQPARVGEALRGQQEDNGGGVSDFTKGCNGCGAHKAAFCVGVPANAPPNSLAGPLSLEVPEKMGSGGKPKKDGSSNLALLFL